MYAHTWNVNRFSNPLQAFVSSWIFPFSTIFPDIVLHLYYLHTHRITIFLFVMDFLACWIPRYRTLSTEHYLKNVTADCTTVEEFLWASTSRKFDLLEKAERATRSKLGTTQMRQSHGGVTPIDRCGRPVITRTVCEMQHNRLLLNR